jgi:hypothetical protein
MRRFRGGVLDRRPCKRRGPNRARLWQVTTLEMRLDAVRSGPVERFAVANPRL